MKKLLSLIIICMLLLSVLPTAAFAERTDDLADTGAQSPQSVAQTAPQEKGGEELAETGDDTIFTENYYKYRILKDGTVELVGATSLNNLIPATIKGRLVTQVAEGAFENKDVTSIIIPDTVRYIGKRAFYRTSLKQVFIPHNTECEIDYDTPSPYREYHEGWEEIERWNGSPFYNDKHRTPDFGSVWRITTSMYTWDEDRCRTFRMAPAVECSLDTKNYLRYAVTRVKHSCRLEMPYILSGIEPGALDRPQYKEWDNLTQSETYDVGAFFDNKILEFTFTGDADITYLYAQEIIMNIDGDVDIQDGNFANTKKNITEVNIKSSIKNIGAEAFRNCSTIKTLNIENGVETIGDRAFYRTALTSVTIPKSVKQIGEQAFGYYFNYDSEQTEKVDGFTVYGHRNSVAERYANENGFTFVPLDTIGLDLWLGSTQVTAANADDIFGDGKVSFDPDTNTLTLHDPTITGVHSYTANDTAKIYTTLPNLTLTGSYHMTAAEAEYGIRTKDGALKFVGDFTFKGAGAGVFSTGTGVNGNKGIRVRRGSLTASGKYGVFTSTESKLTVEEGTDKVDLTGSECAIAFGMKSITVPEMRLISPEGGKLLASDPGFYNYYNADGTTLAKHILLLSYDVKAYDLWLGSTQVTSENQNDILHDGKASFDPETNILTLNNAKITDHYEDGDYTYAIYSKLTSDLTVKGSGKIGTTATRSGIVIAGGGLILDGDFTITGSEYGISSMKGVTFSGGKTTVNGRVIGVLGPVTISAQIARLEVTGSDYAIGSLAGVVIDPEITYVLPKNGTIKDNIISDKDGNPAPHVILEGKPSFILGDADDDGDVTIFDATTLQRHLAQLPVTEFNEAAADADEDGDVTIFDATATQRYLAQLPTNPNIGKPV